MRDQSAERWRITSLDTLESAKRLQEQSGYRSCVSRVYYAAFQAVTSVCIAHGDSVQFPTGWNNPSHEQLPDLIYNNGGYPLTTRRTVRKILRELRVLREDADYRVGRTVDAKTVKSAFLMVSTLFERLEIKTDEE